MSDFAKILVFVVILGLVVASGYFYKTGQDAITGRIIAEQKSEQAELNYEDCLEKNDDWKTQYDSLQTQFNQVRQSRDDWQNKYFNRNGDYQQLQSTCQQLETRCSNIADQLEQCSQTQSTSQQSSTSSDLTDIFTLFKILGPLFLI